MQVLIKYYSANGLASAFAPEAGSARVGRRQQTGTEADEEDLERGQSPAGSPPARQPLPQQRTPLPTSVAGNLPAVISPAGQLLLQRIQACPSFSLSSVAWYMWA